MGRKSTIKPKDAPPAEDVKPQAEEVSGPQPDEFNKAHIEAHNKYRKLHQVAEVVYDEELAKGAQEWANYLHDNDKFDHSETNYGENLAWSMPDPAPGST